MDIWAVLLILGLILGMTGLAVLLISWMAGLTVLLVLGLTGLALYFDGLWRPE